VALVARACVSGLCDGLRLRLEVEALDSVGGSVGVFVISWTARQACVAVTLWVVDMGMRRALWGRWWQVHEAAWRWRQRAWRGTLRGLIDRRFSLVVWDGHE
jgi:hypothetical protein